MIEDRPDEYFSSFVKPLNNLNQSRNIISSQSNLNQQCKREDAVMRHIYHRNATKFLFGPSGRGKE